MPKSFKNCEIETKIEYLENLDEKLQWACIDKYAYIVHDKDVKEDGSLKDAHYHIMIHFKNNSPIPTERIAKQFGVTDNFISKIHGTWSDALKYLTHQNAPEKHQYDESEVHSNFEWEKDIEQEYDEIAKKIVDGTIRECNWTNYIDEPYYRKHEKQIKASFTYARALANKERSRKMQVVYLQGGSGVGKTTYAKFFGELQFGEDDVYISSSSEHPLDEYAGQRCIILDDFRPWDWKLTNLLKLLDNHTVSSANARYTNKNMAYCKLIMITSTVKYEECWDRLLETHGETRKQLDRRINEIISLEESNMKIYSHDQNGVTSAVYEYEYPQEYLEYVERVKFDSERPYSITNYMKRVGCSMVNVKKNAYPSPIADPYPNTYEPNNININNHPATKLDWTQQQTIFDLNMDDNPFTKGE